MEHDQTADTCQFLPIPMGNLFQPPNLTITTRPPWLLSMTKFPKVGETKWKYSTPNSTHLPWLFSFHNNLKMHSSRRVVVLWCCDAVRERGYSVLAKAFQAHLPMDPLRLTSRWAGVNKSAKSLSPTGFFYFSLVRSSPPPFSPFSLTTKQFTTTKTFQEPPRLQKQESTLPRDAHRRCIIDREAHVWMKPVMMLHDLPLEVSRGLLRVC